mgnify:CR=1 FL=1
MATKHSAIDRDSCEESENIRTIKKAQTSLTYQKGEKPQTPAYQNTRSYQLKLSRGSLDSPPGSLAFLGSLMTQAPASPGLHRSEQVLRPPQSVTLEPGGALSEDYGRYGAEEPAERYSRVLNRPADALFDMESVRTYSLTAQPDGD